MVRKALHVGRNPMSCAMVTFFLDNPVSELGIQIVWSFMLAGTKIREKKDRFVPFITPRPLCEWPLFVCLHILDDHVLLNPKLFRQMERTI